MVFGSADSNIYDNLIYHKICAHNIEECWHSCFAYEYADPHMAAGNVEINEKLIH